MLFWSAQNENVAAFAGDTYGFNLLQSLTSDLTDGETIATGHKNRDQDGMNDGRDLVERVMVG